MTGYPRPTSKRFAPDLPRAYAAYGAMLQAARPRNALWRLVVGVVASFVLYMVFNAVWLGAAAILGPIFAPLQLGLEGPELGRTPGGLLVVLFGFAGLTLATAAITRVLHRMPVAGLLGPLPALRVDLRRTVVWVLGLYVVIAVLSAVLPTVSSTGSSGEGETSIAGLAPRLWLALLPLSLLAVFIQTSAEEVFFRGYLQTRLAARGLPVVVWLAGPSALFALGHLDFTATPQANVFGVLWAFVYGIVAGDLVARAGNLGPAIGVHFVNNLGPLLVVGLQGDLSGLALRLYPFDKSGLVLEPTLLGVEIAMLGVMWLAARVALRR
ncbi:CAAX amino terminal protease self-immunity [Aquimixticola soesokkakensis]|uniref:CAAX amino terminal protease self-immunity n=1 Tax=Aquimixticola soesokkakensis TaxID=1519096 RepID=A0A1Y5RG64_9RHOB|nr:type II CAAX endopeptidase family protein [Aquimixticola soesokkakensis]SLN16729.1 CAAX amino terminal protease self-immunity [Aquimixticola soesokkakensis]